MCYNKRITFPFLLVVQCFYVSSNRFNHAMNSAFMCHYMHIQMILFDHKFVNGVTIELLGKMLCYVLLDWLFSMQILWNRLGHNLIGFYLQFNL